MDLAVLIVNGVAMIAGIISAVVAIKAKNEAKKIVTNFKSEITQSNQTTANTNTGDNSGVMAGDITGGVYLGRNND